MLILLFILLAVALACFPYFAKGRALRIAHLVAEVALCILGVLCLFLSQSDIRHALTYATEEYRAWAWDVYTLWARVAAIAAGIGGGIVLVAAAIRHPMQRIRTAVTATVFALLPILGALYLTVATDDLIPALTLWTVGCACLVRFGAAVDAIFFLKTPPKAKNPLKKKK